MREACGWQLPESGEVKQQALCIVHDAEPAGQSSSGTRSASTDNSWQWRRRVIDVMHPYYTIRMQLATSLAQQLETQKKWRV